MNTSGAPSVAASPAWRFARRYGAGLLMVVLGLATVFEARTFGLGTLGRVGPGLYPSIIGGAMALTGLLIAATPEADGEAEAGEAARPDWRGWACIAAGIALFIVLGEEFGLGPGTFACVFVSALGDRRGTPLSALLLALAMTAVALLVFSWGLKFQMPFWRS